jgi:Ni,Fe-hydrogenase III small subunit
MAHTQVSICRESFMFKTLRKIFKVGIVTEKLPTIETEEATVTLENIGAACRKIIDAKFAGSLAIRQVDAGSCNACELEIHALNNSFHDIERFGMHFVASPRHADLLLVTGPVSRHMESALLATYNATPDPKLVIAVGDCGACGGEFGCSYASAGAVSNVIPVDAVIHGCPPTPLALLQGISQLLKFCSCKL